MWGLRWALGGVEICGKSRGELVVRERVEGGRGRFSCILCRDFWVGALNVVVGDWGKKRTRRRELS